MYKTNIKYLFLKTIIIIFSFLFVFSSIDSGYTKDSIMEFTSFINKPIFPHFFSIFEISIGLILLILISQRRLHNNKESISLYIIYIAYILCFILKISNPNNKPNNPILGLAVFSDITEYLAILLLSWILFSDKNTYFNNITYIYNIILIFLLIRFILLLAMYFSGKTITSYYNSICAEIDTTFIIAFFFIFSFTKYIIYKKNKFIFLSIFLLLIEFLTYRRSGLLIALGSSVMLISIYLLKHKKLFYKASAIILILLIYYSLTNIENINIDMKYKKYLYRTLSAVMPNSSFAGGQEFTDSGHHKETELTIYHAFKNPKFWGRGYGKSDISIYLEGQSSSIHNVYADITVRYGIFITLFYILVFVLAVIKLFKITFKKKQYNENDLVELAYVSFLIFYMLALFANPVVFLIHIKMEFLWMTILGVIFKRKDGCINYLNHKIAW